jgi:pyridoxamine 5'-phosphate oxidase
MIQINNLSNQKPYISFSEKYNEALNANQKNIEALSISSFNKENNEVDSRFVNLKFIDKDKFIFFTNYNSLKSLSFESHNQISALLYWSSINVQIRMKAKIKKTSLKYNQEYFQKRSAEKNALAISSRQSEPVASYETVIKSYDEIYKKEDLSKCPKYWGGFSFTPYYFEFWEGHESRINKRLVYKKKDTDWKKLIIQP